MATSTTFGVPTTAAQRDLLRLAAGLSPGATWRQGVERLLDRPREDGPKLLPLLVATLRRRGLLDGLAPALRARLNASFAEAMRLDMLRARYHERLLSRVLALDLTLVLLKGDAFAGWLYGPQAPRPSGDVDWLVHPAALQRLERALEALGFTPFGRCSRHPVTQRLHYNHALRGHGDTPLLVELHVGLARAPLFRVSTDELFERSVPHPGHTDPRVRMLCPEDALLHLAIHAYAHHRVPPRLLVDAWHLIHQGGIHADTLVERATTWRAQTALSVLIDLVQRHLGAPAWEQLPSLSPPGPLRGRIAARVMEVLSFDDAGPPNEPWRKLLALGLLDDPRRAALFLARHVGVRLGDRMFAGLSPPGPLE
jgi:hypothetical protein